MSPATVLDGQPLFLKLPLEIRHRIYEELLCTSITKTPKAFLDNCRSATRYDWNMHPAILATNHQVHDEAKFILGASNELVVIECTTPELEQHESDMGQEKTETMQYTVKLWPGKRLTVCDVPNERLRIQFDNEDSPNQGKPCFSVLLLEELRDVLIGLSIYQGKCGPYRIRGLSLKIAIPEPTAEETQKQKRKREDKLLGPVLKLRFLKSVEVKGAAAGRSKSVSEQLCQYTWDDKLVYSAFHELIESGNQARKVGHHTVSSGYYRQASDYIMHFMDQKRYVFTSPVDPIAFMFQVNLQRSRNWLEEGRFDDALGAGEIALQTANGIFRQNVPSAGPPPRSRTGGVNAGAMRKWTCECIKEGAAIFSQRIKCEEVGAAYYYRSIAELIVEGDDATTQAEQDKMIGIGCCSVSDTASASFIKDLLELDKRIFSGLHKHGGSSDEWEDIE